VPEEVPEEVQVELREELECEKCATDFASRRKLSDHIRGVHTDPSNCEYCHRLFSSKINSCLTIFIGSTVVNNSNVTTVV